MYLNCYICKNNRIYWSDHVCGWILECSAGLTSTDKYDCNEYEPNNLDQLLITKRTNNNPQQKVSINDKTNR